MVAEAVWLTEDTGRDVAGADAEHAATNNATRPRAARLRVIAHVIGEASLSVAGYPPSARRTA
jgi:hypothetical protein